jgi:hypothetical protein
MNEINMTEYRIQRLKDAIDHISKGNKSDFGRKLDMRDGAFIRQMLAGTRPITEKTIRSIEAFHGMDGWFTPPIRSARQSATASGKNLTAEYSDWPFKGISLQRVLELDKDCMKAVESRLIELVDVLLGDQSREVVSKKRLK